MASKKFHPKVTIIDDELNLEDAIRSKLPAAIAKNAVSIPPNKINELVKQLRKNVLAARKNSTSLQIKTSLDEADILIVDYDLIKTANEDYLTGETVAYLARCYSTCGVIVALNQFCRQPTFDLTMKVSLDSFADINLTINDLTNGALWRPGGKGYRPWSWPVLPDLVALTRKRAADVQSADIHTRVVDFLKFPQSATDRMPTSHLELLGCPTKRAQDATLAHVLASPFLGLRGKEASHRKILPEEDSRIIAARLSAWLSYVLTPQDVIVDGPHLAQRCPSLVGEKPTQATMNATAKRDTAVFSSRKLKSARVEKAFWFDRPVWFWTEIERQKLAEEISEPWKTKQPAFVFCEDTSDFVKRGEAKPFQSDLLSPYRSRFVQGITGIDYQPAHRLAI